MNLPPLPTSLDRFTPTEIQSFALRAIVTQYGQQCAQAALEQVRTALDAKAPEPKGLFADLIASHEGLAEELRDAPEPEAVAWQFRTKADWNSGWSNWMPCSREQYKDYVCTKKLHDWAYEPQELYTHPAAREPLTDEQIEEITADNSLDTIHAVARAIELAHGIGAKP